MMQEKLNASCCETTQHNLLEHVQQALKSDPIGMCKEWMDDSTSKSRCKVGGACFRQTHCDQGKPRFVLETRIFRIQALALSSSTDLDRIAEGEDDKGRVY